MIQPVTDERWRRAQEAEKAFELEADLSWARSRDSALFHYLQIDRDQQGRRIVEIGCGPVPVVAACENVKAWLVEPLRYKSLQDIAASRGFALFDVQAEVLSFQGRDEAWLFNTLQHVRDPEVIVANCKQLPIVRFFEPIDYPVSEHHPHSFSLADFRRWFGDCVKEYGEPYRPGFHDGPCAYGVWRNA